ncbi:hypothetical protein [Pelagerythrobacter sp.]|uniref:hypothetical protein n=1 Tax=Pelagerythrobacter sp. TaxID=2800702 RepID=UPI0035B1D28A
MTIHTTIEREGDIAGLDVAALDRLQWQQFEHDEKYHREIARLTVQDRLKHMALHFAKYAGNLAEEPEDEAVKRLVTDIVVIAISSANILNLRISDHHNMLGFNATRVDLSKTITIAAGRMAAACEKMDHLEAFPFRERISESVLELLSQAISYAVSKGWSVEDLIAARLQPVKEKSIFYGRL